uniref:ATP-dependent DNA helicase Q4 n=1 Tax=Leptobrachium leishanense TaxID=445787 RepID=A0A8C5LR04_9ANUR
MQRYEELKLLLKTWESDFLKQQQRKPSKTDIDHAAEETRALYREYQALKQTHHRAHAAGRTLDQVGTEPNATCDEQQQESDTWGSHLNRTSMTQKYTPKMTLQEKDSLKASAQYFGMKLKANLGSSLKERPVSLRKSFSRCAQSSPDQQESGAAKLSETSLPVYTSTSPKNLPELDAASSNDPTLLTGSLCPGDPHTHSTKKLHHLQNMVGHRLASLNQDWLERCEGKRRNEESQSVLTGAADTGTEKSWYRLMGNPSNRNNPTDDMVSNVTRNPSNRNNPTDDMVSNVTRNPSNRNNPTDDMVSNVTRNPSNRNNPTDDMVSNVTRNPSNRNNPTDDMVSNVTRNPSNCNNPTYIMDPSVHEEQTAFSTKARNPAPETAVPRVLASERPNADSNKVTCEESLSTCPDTLPHNKICVEDKGLPEILSYNTNLKLRKGGVKSGPCSSESKDRHSSASRSFSLGLGDLSKKEHSQDLMGSDSLARTPEVASEVASETYLPPSRVESRVKRSRKRKIPCDPDPEHQSPEKCKKRKMTGKKKVNATESPDKEKLSKAETRVDLSENLLGEIMEEEVLRKAGPSVRNASRPTQRNTGNFVRINLKKKSHVKTCALNGNRLRKQMWKQKWQKKGEHFGGGGRHFNHSEDTCFRCGRVGHWASQCPGTAPAQVPHESDSEDSHVELPTLEEVARSTNTQFSAHAAAAGDPSAETVMPLDVVRPVYEPPVPAPPMPPLFGPAADGKVQSLSSLVILSTGMGKSLCYQLPAYMYAQRSPCITLVISPLVSLMDDQVLGLPSKLKAVCIHSNMTRSQREAAMEKVKEGKVHVLLLSPEALVGGGRAGSSCLPPADQLPPVAFACIDEAHCVSEWSHNFRPCYLRLCKVLRERLGVRCLLGLTATATMATAHDVAHHLGVSEDGGIPVRIAAVPPNLHLSVSMDRDRDQALVALLKGERFGCLDSIIVYCTRREETTRISALLRTCLQGVLLSRNQSLEDMGDTDSVSSRKKAQARKKIRRPLKWVADSYHAGLSAAERRRVQNNFMSGQLRLVVATVAFGMGLDKSDVRGIIHYNMPKNFESYVQEIGRAGRDGKDAQCHLFLDPEAQDLDELRRHVYADSVDYFTIKRLVQRAFPPCKCRQLHSKQEACTLGCEVADSEMLDIMEHLEERRAVTERLCHMHERAVPIEETVQALDVREEGVETLLCYLELHNHRWLELLHPTLSTCRVTCYGGPLHLRNVAKSCPPVAVALAVERLAGVDHTHTSSVEFNVVERADFMGWEIFPVKRALRNLQWNRQTQEGIRGTGRSGVLVEFSKLSFHFRSYGDFEDHELEEICDFLYQKVTQRERTALLQLKSCYNAFRCVAYRASSACAEQVRAERSDQLKSLLLEYFEKRDPLTTEEEDGPDEEELSNLKNWKDQVCADIRLFLSIRQDERFSGRAMARIFHGIGSPCYPAQVYGRDRRFWRKYIHLDFNRIMQLCKEEIIRLK